MKDLRPEDLEKFMGEDGARAKEWASWKDFEAVEVLIARGLEASLSPHFQRLNADYSDVVIQGFKLSDLAGKMLTAQTLNGTIAIDGTDGVKINDATVITADVKASNGIIHVIDKVLLPAS
jgi:uncharacterized surface protein with fasciclin (FAS1) repeats